MNEVWNENDFLYADKRQRFARIQLCFLLVFNKENVCIKLCLFIKEKWLSSLPKWFRVIFLQGCKKIFFDACSV